MASEKLHFPTSLRRELDPYLPQHGPRSQTEEHNTKQASRGGHPEMHVTLTYAQSLDSRIAIAPGQPTAISGPLSKAMTHYLRTKHDAILIGNRTAITDDPTLNSRLEDATTTLQPQPIVLDRSCRWKFREESRVFRAVHEKKGRPPWIMSVDGNTLDDEPLRTLRSYGGKQLFYDGSLSGALRSVHEQGLRSVMIEGGATIINELLTNNLALIDSVIVTIAPLYLGQQGVQVAPHAGKTASKTGQQFREVKWMPLGNDTVMLARPLLPQAI